MEQPSSRHAFLNGEGKLTKRKEGEGETLWLGLLQLEIRRRRKNRWGNAIPSSSNRPTMEEILQIKR